MDPDGLKTCRSCGYGSGSGSGSGTGSQHCLKHKKTHFTKQTEWFYNTLKKFFSDKKLVMVLKRGTRGSLKYK
jgi:hypothetical protein